MPTRPLDTSEVAWRDQVRVLSLMTPERRLQIGFELSRMAVRLCEEGIRLRHPEYSERQVFLARARLTLGDDLFASVYPREARLAP